ncbi:MAG TPA: NAD(P)-dependent oxidoreductase [Bryobacteraceae bacterium]|nr:NAD(P)-dependent oxidoreductase [Bryobacteraceae bacterium]
MRVVLYGATGSIGSRILKELLSRGHVVTAVVRDPSKLTPQNNLTIEKGDMLDADSIAKVAKGADVVISSYGPPSGPQGPDPAKAGQLSEATRALIAGVRRAGAPRIIMVGGAGSLEVSPGLQIVDAPTFPDAYKPVALAHRDAFYILRETDLNWTYFSPAMMIQPGERTGKFRLGKDSLVSDEKGNSSISSEDYAVALVDEVEQGRHTKQRFTIGY